MQALAQDASTAWVVPPPCITAWKTATATTACAECVSGAELRGLPSESFSKSKTVGGSRLFHEFAGPGFAQSWDRRHSIPKPRDQLVTTHRSH